MGYQFWEILLSKHSLSQNEYHFNPFGLLNEKKNVMPENFLEINRYFALTSYCHTIGQSNNAFSILGFSLAGKRRGHVLISHPLADKINSEHLPIAETIIQGHAKIALYIQMNRHVFYKHSGRFVGCYVLFPYISFIDIPFN